MKNTTKTTSIESKWKKFNSKNVKNLLETIKNTIKTMLKSKKLKRTTAVIAALLTWGLVTDIVVNMDKDDKKTEFKNHYYDENAWSYFLINEDFEGGWKDTITISEIVKNNPYLSINEDFINAIVKNEEDLKTQHLFWRQLEKFQTLLWTRLSYETHSNSKYRSSKYIISKILKPASHGYLQTQRWAINKYDNTDDYDNILEAIATFKLPNDKWEWEEIWKQFWYKSVDEMKQDIEWEKIELGKWWWRFAVALWTVLLDKIFKDNKSSLDSINVDIYHTDYERTVIDQDKKNDNIKFYNSQKNDDISQNKVQTFLILNQRGSVNFEMIKNILTDNTHIFGYWAALWCTDNVRHSENAPIHYLLSLIEINKNFEDKQIRDGKIVYQTGVFWPTLQWLTNDHFWQNFSNPSDAKNYILENMDIQEEINKEIEKFIKNMRVFFELNKDYTSKALDNSATSLDDIQIQYIQNMIKLTFEHTYISKEIFKQYVINHQDKMDSTKRTESLQKIDNLRDGRVVGQKKGDLDKLILLMTNKEEFRDLIDDKNDQFFELFIRNFLGRWLLATSIVVGKTGLITPVIQTKATMLSNESNTLYRFQSTKDYMNTNGNWLDAIVIENDIYADALTHIFQEGENIREILWQNQDIQEYIKEVCITIDWKSISKSDDIPIEIIKEIVRDINNQKFDDISTLKDWDTIKLKTNYFNDVLYSIEHTVQKSEILRDIVRNNEASRNFVRKNFLNLQWEKIKNANDIPLNVLREIVRDKNNEKITNLNRIKVGQKIYIVIVLNYNESSRTQE